MGRLSITGFNELFGSFREGLLIFIYKLLSGKIRPAYHKTIVLRDVLGVENSIINQIFSAKWDIVITTIFDRYWDSLRALRAPL